MLDRETSNLSVKDTMQIILYAGDARDFISRALDKVAESDYDGARELMKQAHEKLVDAHKIQTKKLQQEAEGEPLEYSVLFTHAQDTAMTIMSEYNLTKKLIDIFEKKEHRGV